MNRFVHFLCVLILVKAGFSTELTRQASVLDSIVTPGEVVTEIKTAERDLPSDKWETYLGRGTLNLSRSAREFDLAHKLLAGIHEKLRTMSVQDLFDSLKTDQMGAGVSYYVHRDGNKMIMEELKRRSQSELNVIRGFREDRRLVFTGANGPILTIGGFVRSVLQHESR